MVQTPTDYIPAFPSQQSETLDGSWNQTYDPGMSLRDYFAAKALNGILANAYQRWVDGDYRTAGCVIDAYEFADAMLDARAQVRS